MEGIVSNITARPDGRGYVLRPLGKLENCYAYASLAVR